MRIYSVLISCVTVPNEQSTLLDALTFIIEHRTRHKKQTLKVYLFVQHVHIEVLAI